MSEIEERDAAAPSGADRQNGNGRRPKEEVDEAEYFLIPLLATDPLPYLFDAEGNPVNIDGNPLTNGNGVPEQIRRLQKELGPHG